MLSVSLWSRWHLRDTDIYLISARNRASASLSGRSGKSSLKKMCRLHIVTDVALVGSIAQSRLRPNLLSDVATAELSFTICFHSSLVGPPFKTRALAWRVPQVKLIFAVSFERTSDKTITMRRLLLIALIMYAVILSDSAKASAADKQSKKSQPSSGSGIRNRSRQVRELINAAANGDTRKVLEILDQGVNVNASFERDDSELSGMTALMVASSRGFSEMVEELIKRRADVNLKRYTGETPLILAARYGDAKTVKDLLRAGANPNAKVMSPHAGEITPLTSTINSDSEQRVEVARILIGARAQINPRGSFLISPLMQAVGDLEMVELLIANGADVNQKNFRGATALMSAATDGSILVVRFLLEKGADVKARDKDGNTALTYAENRREVSDAAQGEEIIQLLRRAQAESKPR